MAEIKLKNLDGFWESIPNLNNNDNNIAPTPNISITSVEGSSAKVTQSGTSENLQVTLTLPKGIDGDIPNESTLLKKSGNLGSLGGYNTPFVTANALTITQDSNDNNQVTGAVTITVNSGSSNTEWIKSVMINNAGTSVSLKSNWTWSGGSAPTIIENSLLVLHWCNDTGVANLVEGAKYLKTYTGTINNQSIDTLYVNRSGVDIYRIPAGTSGTYSLVVGDMISRYPEEVGDVPDAPSPEMPFVASSQGISVSVKLDEIFIVESVSNGFSIEISG